MKAATSSPHGNLRLRLWLMSGSTTGGRALFRSAQERSQPAAPLTEPPDGDPPQRLGGHLAAHLGVPAGALDELDRDLHDPQARLDRPEGEVCLEDVAGRLHLREVDPLQRRTTEEAVAGRGVAYPDAEQVPGVEVPSPREQLAVQRPVDD